MAIEKTKTAIVVAHTHWDREWRYPLWKNRSLLIEFMDWLLQILENDPTYSGFLLDGQTVCIDDYLEIKPQNRDRIAAQVKAGKLAIGPWYTLPDLYPIAGECLVRNLNKGIRFAEELGGYNPIAYHTFGWGQTAQFPQIYQSLGIDYAVASKKISKERAPKCEFMWTSPDGSQLLTSRLGHFTRQNGYFYLHFPVRLNNIYDDNKFGWQWGKTGVCYHRADDNLALNDYFRIDHEDGYFKENVKDAAQRTWDNMDETMVDDYRLLMCGCDFSTPNPYLPQMVKDSNEAIDDIDFKMGSLQEYFGELDKRIDRSQVPVVHGEFRDGEPCGASANALATRIHIKQLNKQAENIMMRRTEPLAAAMFAHGAGHSDGFFKKGWNYLLKAHPHDSINGVTQDKTVDDNIYRLNQAIEIGETIYEDSIASLLKRLDLSKFNAEDQLLLLHHGGRRPPHDARRVEARGDDRHLERVAHGVVVAVSEDDVGLGTRGVLDVLHGRGRVLQTDLFAQHVDQDSLAAGDVHVLEQRRTDGCLGCLDGPVLAFCATGAHHRLAHALHHRTHVGEIEVHMVVARDDFEDSPRRFIEDVVRDAERLGHGRARGHNLKQTLVRNDDEGVDRILQRLDAGLGLLGPDRPLEVEGFGDDADGQGALVPGNVGDDRSGAGTGAATHPCGHKNHVGPCKGQRDVFPVFLGSLAAAFRITSGTEPLRELGPDLHRVVCGGILESLQVSVDREEFDTGKPGFDHSTDCVAAGSSDSRNLDVCQSLNIFGVFEHDISRLLLELGHA
jgi:hypothetical protein